MASENIFLKNLKTMKGRWALFIILILGIAFLVLGRSDSNETVVTESDYFASAEQYRIALEDKIRELCSSIDGVGSVYVTVTLEGGEECVYAKNDGSGSFVISSGEGLLLYKRMPTVRGVAIVCDGGERDDVRLAVADAVSTVCGVGANKISISKKSG